MRKIGNLIEKGPIFYSHPVIKIHESPAVPQLDIYMACLSLLVIENYQFNNNLSLAKSETSIYHPDFDPEIQINNTINALKSRFSVEFVEIETCENFHCVLF